MAVGKGSMERASKAVKKPAVKADEPIVVTKETSAKKPAAKKTASSKTKAKAPQKAVVANASAQVMEQIVYQTSSQMLDRDAKENETFGVGDAMPVYYF